MEIDDDSIFDCARTGVNLDGRRRRRMRASLGMDDRSMCDCDELWVVIFI